MSSKKRKSRKAKSAPARKKKAAKHAASKKRTRVVRRSKPAKRATKPRARAKRTRAVKKAAPKRKKTTSSSARRRVIRAAKKPAKKKPAKRAKPSAHQPSRRPAKSRRKQRDPRDVRIQNLEEQVRGYRRSLEDLRRSRGRSIDSGGDPGGDDGDDLPLVLPPGARVIQRDDSGEPIAFELPPMLQEWSDVDFSNFDWDDLYDAVGDELEDSYGEEAQ